MKLTKAYIVELSTRSEVKIDQDEIDKVLAGIAKGSPIVVRRGIINPSFFVGIQLDESRMDEYRRICGYGGREGEEADKNGMRPLSSIFEGTNVGALLANGQKKIA